MFSALQSTLSDSCVKCATINSFKSHIANKLEPETSNKSSVGERVVR